MRRIESGGGNGIGKVSNINFENLELNVNGKLEISPKIRKFMMIKAAEGAFELENVKSARFSNVDLNYEYPEAWQSDIALRSCGSIVNCCGNLQKIQRV